MVLGKSFYAMVFHLYWGRNNFEGLPKGYNARIDQVLEKNGWDTCSSDGVLSCSVLRCSYLTELGTSLAFMANWITVLEVTACPAAPQPGVTR